ncbi:hypothetical protein E3N88_20788 [Mikania micrantha]|uniref:Uncharacterized protein n=1 Tax=Mikania micrantha TaxID=192012 RepID=A0A5N6NIG0_9ASTR|nr:hypothetical protein E3N88_20787 [Mikania micrantha]KAD4888715.1 hypothetical protein E3N88_20788 [Mikania micrantha]
MDLEGRMAALNTIELKHGSNYINTIYIYSSGHGSSKPGKHQQGWIGSALKPFFPASMTMATHTRSMFSSNITHLQGIRAVLVQMGVEGCICSHGSPVKIVSYKGWKSKTAVKKTMNSNIPADQPLLSTIPASILRVSSDPLYS